MLPIGSAAPDFRLHSTPDQQYSLQDFSGKNLILAFYPADWSPVCGDQMTLYNEMLQLFRKQNAAIVGISVDSKWCHQAYMQSRNLHFPLLADFEPKGAIAKAYESYDDQEGQSLRSLYVLDADGIVRWNYLSPVSVNPGADGILDALGKINAKK
ncbi:redoxin domain-containing protein [Chitinophaga sp. YIM B06452]|uniref:redoxin domain-containing protein n=1 Tax=Chitinophaga sp. YIM B06452 TaxID=3082158 RepID=UPI0031FE57F5